jgi:hypothetical protein
MSKKKGGAQATKTRGKVKGLALALVAVSVLLVGGFAFVEFGGDSEVTPRLPRGGETHAILSPQFFNGAAQLAYAVAEKYPDVMDNVYCYCQCDRPPFFHKSLRTCFATTHGAG